jgi:hypothetical protein
MIEPITAWSSFFTAEVGASATLVGLVVIAISINLSRILAIASLPARAAEALIILSGALVVASAALIPDQGLFAYGVEALAVGGSVSISILILQIRSDTPSTPTHGVRNYSRLAISAAASLPLLAGGILLMTGSPVGLDCIAAGVIVALVAGVATAWVLLVEILR